MNFTGERIISSSSSSWDLYLQHIGRYLYAKPFVAGKTVLDVACGSGYGCQVLSQTAKKVYGVDNCEKTINYCKSMYPGEAMEFLLMDGSNLAFPASRFDTIVSFETLEHLKSPESFIAELNRVLKDDGLLIISTPNKEYFSLYNKGKKNPFHFKEFTQEEFTEIICNRFQLEQMLGQRFFAKKDVPLLSAYTKKKIGFGNDHLLRRVLRIGLRRLLGREGRSTRFLPWEVWANKCKVGDVSPSIAVYMVAKARKSGGIC